MMARKQKQFNPNELNRRVSALFAIVDAVTGNIRIRAGVDPVPVRRRIKEQMSEQKPLEKLTEATPLVKPQSGQPQPNPEPQTTHASETYSSSQGSAFDQALERRATHSIPTAGGGPFKGFGILTSFRERFTPPPPAPPTEEEIKEQEMKQAAERIKANRQRREAEKKRLRKHRGYSSVTR
ncbi:MAG: hypothetical protein ACE5H4_13520 [Candidatus Thorarchaeota archaeon]